MLDKRVDELGGIAKRAIIIKIEFLEILAHQQPLSGRIQELKFIRQPDINRVCAQKALAEGMERGNPKVHISHGQEPVHPLLHFTRRLIGEGQS